MSNFTIYENVVKNLSSALIKAEQPKKKIYIDPKVTNWVQRHIDSRISSFCMGIGLGIDGFINHGLNVCDHTLTSLLTLSIRPLEKAAKELGSALINGIGLPILGIIGTVHPKTAYEFAPQVVDILNLMSTTHHKTYSKISMKIMSIVRGVFGSIKSLSKGFVKLELFVFNRPTFDNHLQEAKIEFTNVIFSLIEGFSNIRNKKEQSPKETEMYSKISNSYN